MWQLGFAPSDEEHVTAYRTDAEMSTLARRSNANLFTRA